MEEIAQALGISHGSVSTFLHDRLRMRKLTAHCNMSLNPLAIGKRQPEHQYAVPC